MPLYVVSTVRQRTCLGVKVYKGLIYYNVVTSFVVKVPTFYLLDCFVNTVYPGKTVSLHLKELYAYLVYSKNA